MAGPVVAEAERIALERDRLRLERQKLALEIALKRRELSANRRGWLKELLSNPLALAIVGGFITLMTGIIGGAYTAYESRRAETLRAEIARDSAREALQAELIKKFVEGPTPTVRGNLKFLVDAGLLPIYADRISAYLRANPETAPQVPTLFRAGDDGAVPVETLPSSDPTMAVVRSVGLLIGPNGPVCTAFLISPDTALTAGHCVTGTDSFTLRLGGHQSRVTVGSNSFTDPRRVNYAVLRLNRPVEGATGLKLSNRPPRPNEPVAIVLFRGNDAQLAARCQVIGIDAEVLKHKCATGAGASGAPILSADGREVLGIHTSVQPPAKQATRVDVIAQFLSR